MSYADLLEDRLRGVSRAAPWRRALAAAFKPRPKLTLSQWADGRLVIGGSEPGFLRLSRTPWLREPLDVIGDSTTKQVVLMFGAQLAKTTAQLCAMAYFASQDPAAMLFVAPSEVSGRGFVKERVELIFRSTPSLRGLLDERAHSKTTTVALKQFTSGAQLALAWATSASALASRPVRVVLADELDRWPATTAGDDGAPWPQAKARTATFLDSKWIACSTPLLERTSLINQLYEDSDRRRYHLPFPCCGVMAPLEFEQLIFKRAGVVDLDDVHYVCQSCGARVDERSKPEMVSRGEWIADNRGQPAAGFQLSSLYSPWTRWAELAREFVAAVEARDWLARQSFTNLRLGLPWRDTEQSVTVEALEKNVENYGDAEVPDPALVVTIGVDTQDDRLCALVLAWGQHKECWAISYVVLLGDTSDLSSPVSPWVRLDTFIGRAWLKADGTALVPQCIAIDSGGHRTQETYSFAAARFARGVIAVHGVAGSKPIAGKPTQNARRAPLVPVGVEQAKATLFSRLMLPPRGPGGVHFPDDGRGFDAAFFLELTAERRTVKRGKVVWEKVRRRNEALDAFVYATAALELLFGPNPALLTPRDPSAPAPVPRRRRVLSRGITE